MKKLLLSGLFLILGIGVLGFIMVQTSPPPTVEGSNAESELRTISANAPLALTFSRWMDKESTEAAVKITPPKEGSFSWKGNTLQFTPKEKFTIGDTYAVEVNTGAKSTFGKNLSKPYKSTFLIGEVPKLIFSAPNGGESIMEVGTEEEITLMFNQPMVALTSLDSAPTLPLEITPKTEGKFEWLDTSTMQFIPKNGLIPASSYSVKVPKGTKAADGGYTEEEYAFTFETLAPKILSRTPVAEEVSAGPSTVLTVQANQKLNLESLKEKTKITPEKELVFSYSKESENTIEITPKTPWDYEKTYTLTHEKGIRGAQGEKTLSNDYIWSFTTVGTPMVSSSSPEKDAKNAEIYGVSLNFSNPMEEASFKDAITIEPKVEFTQSFNGTNYLSIDAQFAYSTAYKVTLKKQAKDIYGQEMKEDFTLSFTTQDRPKSISLVRTDYFSLFSAYEKPVYPIKTVNISKAEITFCTLDTEAFFTSTDLYSNTKPNCTEEKTWTTTITPKKNELVVETLDIEKELGKKLTPGIYYLSVNAPEAEKDNYWKTDRAFFFITKTSLAMKKDQDKMLLWATDLKTGLPVENMDLTIYRDQKVIGTGKTDSKGLASLALPGDQGIFVKGTKEDDLVILSGYWANGIASWDFNLEQDYNQSAQIGYLHTDRPIYRPGDVVHFKGMVRVDKEAGFGIPGKDSIANLTIQDPEYNEVQKMSYPLSANGTFQGELALPKTGKTGRYTITWTINDLSLARGDFKSFYVEEYRKPEFEVKVTPKKDALIKGDGIEAMVAANYYFGGVLSEAPVEWTLQKSSYFWNEYHDGWYNFSGEDYEFCWWSDACSSSNSVVTKGTGKLNNKGELAITLPLVTEKEKSEAALYTLEVTVTDTNKRTVSNRVSLPVHPGSFYLGIRNENYLVNKGEDANFELISVDPKGMPLAKKKMTVEFVKREWKSVQKANVDGEFYWETEKKDTVLGTKEVTTGDDGKGKVNFALPGGGYYIARTKATDERGNLISSTAGVYGYEGDAFVSWERGNNNRMEIIADKMEYKIGDTAKLLIKSPFENVQALVTYERKNIFKQELITITSTSHTLSIPVTEEFLPNTYISVILMKGSGEQKEGTYTKPEFRVGYKNLNVNTEGKKLTMEVKSDKPHYLPGGKVKLTFTTKDSKGNPKEGEIALAVVDASVLALKGNTRESLMDMFYFRRGLGVFTAHNLTIFTESVLVKGKGAKGGGGGEDELEKKKRGEFKDTAYWNPEIITKNGTATVEFTLPDNLTTWNIFALGITKDTELGSVESSIQTKKPLMVRPVLPRFVRYTDRITVGALVQNSTDKEQLLTISMAVENGELKSPQERVGVKILPGEEKRIDWNVQAGTEKENMKFTFKAENGEVKDELVQVLPLYTYATPEVVATMGETTTSTSQTVILPENAAPNLGGVKINVASTLLETLGTKLDYLITYPYGCAEQITSKLLGLLSAKQGLLFPSGFTEIEKAEREKRINDHVAEALPVIYTYQAPDGGWGYWKESKESIPYLSGYVFFGLTQAESAGYQVDSRVMEKGRNYLTTILKKEDPKDPRALEKNTKAFFLYVLSLKGEPDMAIANKLYEERKGLSKEARAYIALVYSKKDGARAKSILTELLNESTTTTESRYVFFAEEDQKALMGSSVRTTARILEALATVEPKHPLLPKIARWVVDHQKSGVYQSTQDISASLQALFIYQKSQESISGFEAKVTQNGTEILKHILGKEKGTKAEKTLALGDLLGKGAENLFTFSKEGTDGMLYYTMELSYFLPIQEIAPKNRGFSITRQYYKVEDKENKTPVTFAKNGETLRGKITIVVPEERHMVAVESFLPAGFEPVNFALDTEKQSLQEEGTLETNPEDWWREQYFTHTEMRDDRVVLFADTLPKGVYEYEYFVTAGNSGIYTAPPARVYEMYYPEVFGRSKGEMINVNE